MPTTCDVQLEDQTDGLAAEISMALCRATADDLEGAVGTMLARIDDVIGVDRTTLIEYDNTGRVLRTACSTGALTGLRLDASDSPRAQWPFDELALVDDIVAFDRIPDDLPRSALTPALLEWLNLAPVRSMAACRVAIAGERICALIFETETPRRWEVSLLDRLRLFTEIMAAGLHRRRQEQRLRESRDEVERLTERLQREGDPVDYEGGSEFHFDEIIGKSAALRTSMTRLHEVADTDSTVLLLGETGTGKELFARAIHNHGPRRLRPLVIVNCAALPPTLIESELFGHARGAFTGATEARQGRFELANHGTLFLDEIGDLPLDLQTKLLRVLQEGTFERLGSSQTQKVDVRIIAATHRNLSKSAADGQFRSDLFYRLNVFPIRVPPLRERAGDIPELVWFIIHKRQRAMHRSIKRVPEGVMNTLRNCAWPGNVRELENVIERALIHSTGDTLRLLDEPSGCLTIEESNGTLNAVERTHINEVLQACRWRINGVGNAAERLGIHPNTLRFRMKKLGIARSRLQPVSESAGQMAIR